MTAPDIIHVSQPGKLVGRRVQVGVFKTVETKGVARLKFTLTKRFIDLGDGIELSTEMPEAPFTVPLAITAAAAKRIGMPHPGNPPELTDKDGDRLAKRIGNSAYGQQEQRQAIVDLERAGFTVHVDPQLRAWIFS